MTNPAKGAIASWTGTENAVKRVLVFLDAQQEESKYALQAGRCQMAALESGVQSNGFVRKPVIGYIPPPVHTIELSGSRQRVEVAGRGRETGLAHGQSR
jgi:hypothetical protein